MKIAHVCLSCFYIDGQSYQENELVRQHVKDGHEVIVIASTEQVKPTGEFIYSKPSVYMGSDGATVKRLPYRMWPAPLARKLRIHSGVFRLLQDFEPDAILFHGCCGWEVATAARYARENPRVLFYIDSHEDWNNSARTFASREFLHKIYYRLCLARALKTARKVLCISTETMDFVEEIYHVPRSKLEFFPLGGIPIPAPKYADRRQRTRQNLGVQDTEIMFIQSGKQTRSKKLLETLRAFKKAAPGRARLFIVGSIDPEIESVARALIADDPRVTNLGWKTSDQLTDLLCAADVYVQPGTQSVTMQHSLCCHCAIILDDAPSHAVYMNHNGWLIDGDFNLESAFSATSTADLEQMQERSYEVARRMLDYEILSRRVLRANA